MSHDRNSSFSEILSWLISVPFRRVPGSAAPLVALLLCAGAPGHHANAQSATRPLPVSPAAAGAGSIEADFAPAAPAAPSSAAGNATAAPAASNPAGITRPINQPVNRDGPTRSMERPQTASERTSSAPGENTQPVERPQRSFDRGSNTRPVEPAEIPKAGGAADAGKTRALNPGEGPAGKSATAPEGGGAMEQAGKIITANGVLNTGQNVIDYIDGKKTAGEAIHDSANEITGGVTGMPERAAEWAHDREEAKQSLPMEQKAYDQQYITEVDQSLNAQGVSKEDRGFIRDGLMHGDDLLLEEKRIKYNQSHDDKLALPEHKTATLQGDTLKERLQDAGSGAVESVKRSGEFLWNTGGNVVEAAHEAGELHDAAIQDANAQDTANQTADQLKQKLLNHGLEKYKVDAAMEALDKGDLAPMKDLHLEAKIMKEKPGMSQVERDLYMIDYKHDLEKAKQDQEKAKAAVVKQVENSANQATAPDSNEAARAAAKALGKRAGMADFEADKNNPPWGADGHRWTAHEIELMTKKDTDKLNQSDTTDFGEILDDFGIMEESDRKARLKDRKNPVPASVPSQADLSQHDSASAAGSSEGDFSDQSKLAATENKGLLPVEARTGAPAYGAAMVNFDTSAFANAQAKSDAATAARVSGDYENANRIANEQEHQRLANAARQAEADRQATADREAQANRQRQAHASRQADNDRQRQASTSRRQPTQRAAATPCPIARAEAARAAALRNTRREGSAGRNTHSGGGMIMDAPR